MAPAPPDLAGPSDPPSVLELAFSDAVEGAGSDDKVSVRLLDAAYEQFCLLGVRRTTMTDVARLAGVSRITVYRRFPTKEALVEHVVRREFRRYFDQFVVEILAAETVADRVVLGFVSSLRTVRGSRLIGGLMAVEPDVVVPSMTGDGGRTLHMVQQFVAERLRREQEAGHVAARVDVGVAAEMMVRISASFLTIPSRVIDLDDDARLREVARQCLVPMLGPAPAGQT
ncbi:TetR/AcrR family transcriptional regulator [uncultured Streptomyces sp.]|uniref:TetR/AcrR family transcriptional regulator n=1 Tax=uncultured Streptomyces sp. TaxID=174707 RepID=UPI00261EF371|nr:TetR/AcrR family transcriptional regulator [uncultured Streptomyces sp.]